MRSPEILPIRPMLLATLHCALDVAGNAAMPSAPAKVPEDGYGPFGPQVFVGDQGRRSKVKADMHLFPRLARRPMSRAAKLRHAPRRRLSYALVAAFPRIATLAWAHSIRDGS